MIGKLASISSVCDVNPGLPAALRGQGELLVTFVPMSAVKESGLLEGVETRQLRDTLKGYTYFEQGDILVAKITPCMENGKVAQAVGLPQPVGFGSTEFHVLRPGPDVDGRYLFHMVWNPYFRSAAVGSMTGSAGQRRVPASFFARFRIPLPPLPEQRRIATVLDKADAIRRKRRETLDLADQFLRSTFLDMFGDPVKNTMGWPVVRFGELLDDISYGTSRKCLSVRTPGAVAVLRIPNVLGGRISWHDVKYCRLGPSESAKLQLEAGDLLFVRTNGNPDYIGRCAVFDDWKDAAYASYLIRARLLKGVPAVPVFLREQISFPSFRSRLIRETRTTAGNYNISARGLERLRLVLPPMHAQQRFLRATEGICRLCEKLGAALQEDGRLLDCVAQRSFRGEL